MNCPQCRHDNPAPAKFCEQCGARLNRVCPACASPLSAAARFCPECGQPAEGPDAPEPRFGAPDAYTPKHLAEKILSSRSALEGERKQVTVLFADMQGSMALLADRDPEEAREILDPVLERMMEAVHRYEGTVNQVMGDGIMALFGAPLAHEDHAVRACYAALRMRDAVAGYAETLADPRGLRVQIRVGINSGEVVVRSIRSDLHMDYTAVGQTTHLAARMEQIASSGSILVTAQTLRLAEGFLQARSLGPMPIKGVPEPVEAFEVLGATGARSRLQASAARGFTEYVGRTAELELLRRAMDRARAGHGQVVAVVGEPGMGKSRLVWELTHSAAGQGGLVLESSAVSHGRTSPYFSIVELLKNHFRIEARDSADRITGKVTERLVTLGLAPETVLAPILFLLDVPPRDPGWQKLDPAGRRARIFEAVKALLLRQTQIAPLLLIVENLHWIDGETQAVLDMIVESLPASRMLLFVNYRPEYEHHWGGKSYYTQVRLDPLGPESARLLLDSLLGNDPSLVGLKEVLIERTEGNPFFLEESVRTLVETGALAGGRDAYRLTQPARAVDVPASVQALLAARIDRLPPVEKQLLQAASVIGKDVPFPLLEATAGLPVEDLRRGLARLRAGEFLYEARLFPDLEYTFKHALTHQVAYNSLLHERRRALHAGIALATEALYGDRRAEHVERLAHHTIRGELWEKAVTYLRQAGTKAVARAAYREAAACFEQALAALEHLPSSRTTVEDAIDLRLNLRASLRPLGELPRVVEYLREAERLAQTLDDPRRLGWVSAWMSQSYWVTGRSLEARSAGEKAKAIAEVLQEVPLTVVANLVLGLSCLTSGDFPQAKECFMNMMLLLEGDLSRERFGTSGFPAVQCRAWLAWSLAERGAFAEGIAYGDQALRIGETVDDPYSLTIAYLGLGTLYAIKGDLGHAGHLLERGLQLAQAHKVTLQMPRMTGILGYTYALSGRVSEGLALLDEALVAIESMEQVAFQALLVARRGEVCLLADRRSEALACAERAIELARERGQRAYEAWALRLLGEVLARADTRGLDEARSSYRQAMALGEELGMSPLIAHCHLGLGRLSRRAGERGPARQHLAGAATSYRELDMPFWLKAAEAEIDST
jgi:class 3 adenylate cyclase/tetratricopeptide (TPR) repeat protein